jgi:hypothetical protein
MRWWRLRVKAVWLTCAEAGAHAEEVRIGAKRS